MSNILNNAIYKDLANNCFNITDYDFQRLIDFIKFQKSFFTLDLLFLSFTCCYNQYLDKIKEIDKSKNLESYKKDLSNLSYRCQKLSELIIDFDEETIKNFAIELKNLILTLFINDDYPFSYNFCVAYSKVEPFSVLKFLKKNQRSLDGRLLKLFEQLKEEFEQYQHLSYEVESIISKHISDIRLDLPSLNYLDFL